MSEKRALSLTMFGVLFAAIVVIGLIGAVVLDVVVSDRVAVAARRIQAAAREREAALTEVTDAFGYDGVALHLRSFLITDDPASYRAVAEGTRRIETAAIDLARLFAGDAQAERDVATLVETAANYLALADFARSDAAAGLSPEQIYGRAAFDDAGALAAIERLRRSHAQRTAAAQLEIDAAYARRSLIVTLGMSSAALLLVVSSILVIRALRRQLLTLGTGVVELADGRLTGRVALNASGAVGTVVANLNRGIEDLESLITSVKSNTIENEQANRKLGSQIGESLIGATEIAAEAGAIENRMAYLTEEIVSGAGAVEEIHATIESLVQRIGAQSNAVQSAAGAIEEISASIANLSAIAGGKRRAAEQLVDLTEGGRSRIESTDAVIARVTEQVQTVHQTLDLINDVAARTNLLAMNAAIEAAHAGDAGRGFAIVATQIRDLAQSTATNAATVAETLDRLVTDMGSAHEASADARRAFEEIAQSAESVGAAFEEIASSTEELATGADEVVNATITLRDISDEITGSAEEMRIGAEDVTRALTSTREIAQETFEAVKGITGGAARSNTSIHRISEMSVEANDRLAKLIRAIERFHVAESFDERDALERLQLASIMLKHIGWVARARAMIDGVADIATDDLVDHTKCAMGMWLATEGKVAIGDPAVYRKLYDTHKALHETVTVIVERVRSNDRAEVESLFQTLLSQSRTIVEMLTAEQPGDHLQWTRAIAVNVPVFDAHHKRLFAIIDRLSTAMQNGESHSVLTATFDELLDYTNYHFGSEARALQHYKYPACEAHMAEHAKLVKRALELRREMDSGKAMISVEVMEFLRDWITNHIRKCDMLYRPHLEGEPVGEYLEAEGVLHA